MTILSMLRERLTEVAWQLMSLEARGGDEVQIAALRATAVALRGALKDAEQILGRPITARLGGSRLVSVSWTGGGARIAAVKIALRDYTALDIITAELGKLIDHLLGDLHGITPLRKFLGYQPLESRFVFVVYFSHLNISLESMKRAY